MVDPPFSNGANRDTQIPTFALLKLGTLYDNGSG